MVKVDEESCVGCGICIYFCSVDALEGWGMVSVNQEKCIGCLDCIEACLVDALKEEE